MITDTVSAIQTRRMLALFLECRQNLIDIMAIVPTCSKDWLAVDKLEQDLQQVETQVRLGLYLGHNR